MGKPRIGVTYDLRSDYLALGYSDEEVAEYDSEVTIDAICSALRALGWQPVKIGGVRKLADALACGERWDAVFNFCEGMHGLSREAQVPALLDVYQIPYVFSDALTMAMTLHKGMAKRVVRDAGIATADFTVVECLEDMKKISLAYPLFLKPVAEGSGKGVGSNSKVTNAASLKRVAEELLEKFRQPVLVETFLPGREFTVGITGSGEDAEVLGVTEIMPKANWVGDGYGFENKEYWEDKVSNRLAPTADAKAAGEVALAAWRVLRCRDGGRIDIRYDANGKPHFIEVNPLAGMRPDYSDLCFIANYKGVSYLQLIGRIMDSFLKRHPALKPAVAKPRPLKLRPTKTRQVKPRRAAA
ncbi:MAG: D-alanine--D-alanine ligase [Proteobacteria bacterium]|nr:D-alanine--D-alanine ligase [Pseudomonadota bacterium]